MIDHTLATLKQSTRREAYKNYITDTLRYIVNNTADQESRTVVNMSYQDMINQSQVSEQDKKDNDRKAQDIIEHMKNKLGGDTL